MSASNGHRRPNPTQLAAIEELARRKAIGGSDDGGAAYEAQLWSDIETEKRRMLVRERAREALDGERGRGSLAALPPAVSLADALGQPDPPTRYRIDRLLPAEGNATLVAPRKTGKTTAVINLVRSLADGVPFLGEFRVTPPAGRIVVLNFEVSHAQLVRWYREVPIQRTDRISLITLRGHRLPLMTTPGQRWLAEQLRAAEAEMLVVDPFGKAYRAAGGQSENDSSEVGRFLDALDEVKQAAGVAELVMPVHGARDAAEGRERARGASALEDWPDAIWRLSTDDTQRRYLSAIGRDVDVPEARLSFDESTRLLTVDGAGRAQQRLDDAEARVVELLASGSRSRYGLEKELVRGGGPLTRRALDDALRSLQASEQVANAPGPRDSTVFRLTSPLV